MKDLVRVLRAFFVTLIFANLTFAQSNTGNIRGTVFDSHGAVVSGATVTITNLGTSRSMRLITSPTGAFGASNLDPVLYRVEVENTGFKKAVVESLKVDTASVATVNVSLEPGTVATQVEVTAQTPVLNTETG